MSLTGDEHSEAEQEEEEEEIPDETFVNKTYEDLREAYNQIPPEESDIESTKDADLKVMSSYFHTKISEELTMCMTNCISDTFLIMNVTKLL